MDISHAHEYGLLRFAPRSTATLQFLQFCAVGVVNTLVDLSVYYILTRSIWVSGLVTLPKALSNITATLGSFFMNRYWTFGKRNTVRLREVGKFYVTVGLGIFVNVGVMYVAVSVFSINDIIGAILAAVATALWGFSFSKWYVFKK